MKQIYQSIVIVLLILCLTGCFAGKTPPQSQYLFAINYPAVKKAQNQITLDIQPLQALPQYSSTEFLYRVSKYNYIFDYYNVFLVPANQQITTVSAEYLTNFGLFNDINIANYSSEKADYILSGTITALYADYQNSAQPKAVMSIRYVLYDNQNHQKRILLNKIYSQAVPLQVKSTPALMAAWNSDLASIMYQLGNDIAQVVKISL